MPTDQSRNNEKELLARLAAGDEKAMEEAFDAFYLRLYYFAKKLTRNESEAEDIAQEALVNFWVNVKDKGVEPDNMESYLFQMVRNRCYTFNMRELMKAGKQDDLSRLGEAFEHEVENQLMREDIFNRIFREFNRLPGQQALIMKMIYIDGLHTNEIAAQLNISPNNVRNQKARALDRLRTFLADSLKFFLFFY